MLLVIDVFLGVGSELLLAFCLLVGLEFCTPEWYNIITHTIHGTGYIYLHLVSFDGKCR